MVAAPPGLDGVEVGPPLCTRQAITGAVPLNPALGHRRQGWDTEEEGKEAGKEGSYGRSITWLAEALDGGSFRDSLAQG